MYVIGYSEDISTSADYATVKYDGDGNELWVTRYNGLDNYDDKAMAIAVTASGDSYVTGSSRLSLYAYDCATVKYDSDGEEVWVARYNDSTGAALVLDDSCNVYITGHHHGNEYVTMKYDSDGKQIWGACYDSAYGFPCEARAIAVDNWGNAYVTGRATSTLTSTIRRLMFEEFSYQDYATIKYTSASE